MPAPDLAVLAEGDLSTGEHWILRAGGTSTDFYTFLETVHPDGHRDQGGMAHKARSSNHRIWPGTRQPGSASCGGTAARRLEHPVQPGWGPHPGPPANGVLQRPIENAPPPCALPAAARCHARGHWH